MIQVIIIEDEEIAAENLKQTLEQFHDIHVKSIFRTVKEAVRYLNKSTNYDLILTDVELTDGNFFEIFKQTNIKVPIIFITGFDIFMIDAFDYNGIDYIVKPFTKQQIEKALHKYRTFKTHFTSLAKVNDLMKFFQNSHRRIIVHKGAEHTALPVEDVVLFFTLKKVVYSVTAESSRLVYDGTLSELENELSPSMFFRANRQYIINIKYIKSYKTFERVKILVNLNVDLPFQIVVSQDNAGAFRRWIAGKF